MGKSLVEAQKLNEDVVSEKTEYMQKKIEERNEELKCLMGNLKKEKEDHEKETSQFRLEAEKLQKDDALKEK